jgi:hypothetical protein
MQNDIETGKIAKKNTYPKDSFEFSNAVYLDYLISNYASLNLYSKKMCFSREKLMQSINDIKEKNPDLYNIYERAYLNKIYGLKNIDKLCTTLCDILSSDKPFTVLDCTLLTDIPIDLICDDMLKASKFNEYNNISKDPDIINKRNISRKIISKFRALCYSYKPIDIVGLKNIMLDNKKRDDNELRKVFSFMQRNNIPVNNDTYKNVIRAYYNNEIDLNKTYTKKINTGYLDFEFQIAQDINNYYNEILENDDVKFYFDNLHQHKHELKYSKKN